MLTIHLCSTLWPKSVTALCLTDRDSRPGLLTSEVHYCTLTHFVCAEVMEKAESSEMVVDAETVLSASGTYQEALDVQHILHARLVATNHCRIFQRQWVGSVATAFADVQPTDTLQMFAAGTQHLPPQSLTSG